MSDNIVFDYVDKDPTTGQLTAPPQVFRLAWKNLTVTHACAIVLAEAGDGRYEEGEHGKLRDILCDLTDDLAAFGLRLPLVLVVDCRDKAGFGFWHRIAGDQDWHRGAFSIMTFHAETYSGSKIEDVGALVHHIFDQNRLKTKDFKLEMVTAEKYAELLEQRLEHYLDGAEGVQSVDGDLYRAFIRTIVAQLRAGGMPEQCVERWLDEEVAPWAHVARALGFSDDGKGKSS